MSIPNGRSLNDQLHEQQQLSNLTTFQNRSNYDSSDRKKQKIFTVSDYKVVTQIGKGGFAEVYKVESLKEQGQFFAMKLSKKMPIHTDQEDFDRYATYNFFMKEWRAYERLAYGRKDENGVNAGDFGIPKIFEKGVLKMGMSGLYPYMIMQLLGPALSSFLKAGSGLPLDSFVKLGEQIIKSIQYIHSKGMVHRDIKPSNMCMSTEMMEIRVYLVDMGFVKVAPVPEEYDEDESEDFVGTPDYASENSLRGKLQGYKDDIEQLGFTMLELILGDLPWSIAVPYGSKSGWSSKQLNLMADNKQAEILRLQNAGYLPEFWIKWMEHVNTLSVFDKPNYQLLIDLVRSVPNETIKNMFHKK
eukprot:TRINITY_DN22328_c1_g1_i1.p1 TRINITY_DN22328_c1_g1~~TRINITY_DN22328_c1_g1_i1.p1  ORF type:complete len:358 (-),score=40.80 TRINITY_DN22328_c1_g1_i1:216-1289(-)